MRRATLSAFSIVVALAAATAALAKTSPPFVGPRIAHPSVAPDFALRDQHGQLIRLSAQRGKVVVVTFLYTHCPDLCPLTAMHVQAALDKLGARRAGVSVLAVSVDPEGDTPSSVRRFVRTHRLGPQFHYLTASRKTLSPIWREYNVTSVKVGGADPDHTLYVLLLDRSGKSRVLFDAQALPAAIAHDLRLLL
ncbi:MAG TPA: SCO family protein [Gaiellaceae bacterium]|jgi:protein SCO1|nr:SCO family protein [Gaiellaceae bacterium]